MATTWANCPFCSQVFEVTVLSRTVVVDRKRRIVCGHCVKRFQLHKPLSPQEDETLPALPNGNIKKEEGNGVSQV